ncbi:tripartite tricarboxylate transporter substrate binding protein [Hominifimenecus sp. rT4P-3]|uniref:tripartite tricarboxylate transporter substrate binding protein n=1 Tax=Hominifimenecus sp. rT4P-3 TaxID=3242979 RepID=UPI003DA56623
MKKTIAMFLALAMTAAVSLTGCSSESSKTTTAPASTAAVETAAAENSTAGETTANAEDIYASDKTVTIITDADPGNNSDILTRKWAELFTKYSGCKTMVVNETASSGIMAMNMLLKEDADGFTLLQQSQSLPLTVAAGTAPFAGDSVSPLFGLTNDSMWITVAADSQYQSIEDLIKACQENPGKVNGAGNKTKGIVHYWACLLMQDMEIDFNFIPYDTGNEQITAVLAGDADFMLLSNNRSSTEVQGGSMRCLALTGDKHYDVTPDTPTLGELGYENANSVTVWRGMFCKSGTDEAVMDRLEEINAQIVADPAWEECVTGMGMSVSNKNREEFTQAYNDVIEWGKNAFEWYDNK